MSGAASGKLMDDDLLNELINYIKVGNYLDVACAAVGITQKTYYKWLSTGAAVEEMVAGRDDEDELKQRMTEGELVLAMSVQQVRSWNFRREALKASAISEAYAVAMVRSQMPQQWTAAMTFLERRFPGRWKRREQIDIGEAETHTGIDETILLQDPGAIALIHDALERVSKKELTESTDDKEPPSNSSGAPESGMADAG